MQVIKQDGTFQATSGAAYNYIEKLLFNKNDYELITLAETDYDDNAQQPIYFISEVKVSNAEGEEYFQTFYDKENIIMYSFGD